MVTHSWAITLDQVSVVQFSQLGKDALTIFDVAKEHGIALAYDYNTPDRGPAVGEGVIRFNGVGEEGHQAFHLDCSPNTAPVEPRPASAETLEDQMLHLRWQRYDAVVAQNNVRLNFCATRGLPYDAVVGAVLMRAKEVFGTALVVQSTSSFDEEWAGARVLYAVAFSRTGTNPLE